MAENQGCEKKTTRGQAPNAVFQRVGGAYRLVSPGTHSRKKAEPARLQHSPGRLDLPCACPRLDSNQYVLADTGPQPAVYANSTTGALPHYRCFPSLVNWVFRDTMAYGCFF